MFHLHRTCACTAGEIFGEYTKPKDTKGPDSGQPGQQVQEIDDSAEGACNYVVVLSLQIHRESFLTSVGLPTVQLSYVVGVNCSRRNVSGRAKGNFAQGRRQLCCKCLPRRGVAAQDSEIARAF